MPAAAVIAVIFGYAPLGPDPIGHARPALVPHGDTTREIADSGTAAAHPTHLATGAYEIDTVCEEAYCVEELRARGRVLIAHAKALRALQREVADPADLDEVDATEVVLPQPSAGGYLSVGRVESHYFEGAAHANSSARCETYDTATGTLVTLRDVVGARAARRIAVAAGHGTRSTTTNLLVPIAGVVFLCDPDRSDITADPPAIVLRVDR